MHKFLALTRKEAADILKNPPILFATAFFILLDSFAFYLTTVRQATPVAEFGEIALFILFTSIILYPFVSMHSLAQNNADGTIETLLTAPVGTFSVVLAKYSGAMLFVLLHLLHGLVYAVLLDYGGNLDWYAVIPAFLALVAFGSIAMSLGVFISSLTTSPVAAAAGTGGILLFLAIVAGLDPYSGNAANLLYSMSYLPDCRRWISGEIDLSGCVYFISVTAFCLLMAWLAINNREPANQPVSAVVRRRLTVTYLLVLVGFVLLALQAAIIHIKGFWEGGHPFTTAFDSLPLPWFLPLLFAAGAFVWSTLTFRAARRAQKNDAGGYRNPKYATISDTAVMKAPIYYYEENNRASRRLYLTAFASLVILVNINWLSHYPWRTFADSRPPLRYLTLLQDRSWDFTREGINSLSPVTRRALDSLQGRMQFYSFLPEDLAVHDVPVAVETRHLLERYHDYNTQFNVSFADAVREPELAKQLAEELDIKPENLAGSIVADYQGRRIAIPAASLAAPPDWRRQSAGDDRWVYDGERRITQTVMHLADPRVPRILFSYGHLESSLAGGIHPDRTASRLARALAGANMQVRQHSISQTGGIPSSCDVFVIASPRVHFKAEETEVLRNYLTGGGRLLVLAPGAGPDYTAADDPLNNLLFELGGSYRDDIIEDKKNNDHGQALAPLGRSRGGGEGGGAVGLVFPLARSIRDNPRVTENGWTSERMIESYPEAISTAMGSGEKRPGPFTLAYRSAAQGEAREARLVVMASGRMVSDADIGRGANEALMLAMVHWLAGREETGEMPARAWIDRRLWLTGAQLRGLMWIALVGLPLAWVLAGVSVWWLRRE